MRKLATTILGLILSGLGAIVAEATPKPADQQPRTMEDVIDRVITNENRAVQQIRQYSPLVETYIQNLKLDKDLGYTPAGDKYFLGRADFSKGVSLISLTDTNTKGKKIFGSIGNFFSFALQFVPDGFLQMIFLDTNGFDKQHYKFDYVRREFLGEVRCLVFDVTPQEKSGKGRFLGRIWVEDQDFNIVRFNGAYSGKGHALQFDEKAGLQSANAPLGLQPRTCQPGTGIEQDPGGIGSDGRYENRERPVARPGAAYLGPPGGRQRHRSPGTHRSGRAEGRSRQDSRDGGQQPRGHQQHRRPTGSSLPGDDDIYTGILHRRSHHRSQPRFDRCPPRRSKPCHDDCARAQPRGSRPPARFELRVLRSIAD